MHLLFNNRLRPGCNIYLPYRNSKCTDSRSSAVPLSPARLRSPTTGTVEDRRSSVDYKGRLVKFEPQPIDRLQNSGSTQQLLFQATLTGKVKEHDSQQNRQQPLARHSRNRQQNTNGDQQDAKSVLANNSRGMKGRMTS